MMGLTAAALAQLAQGRVVGADRALGAAVIDSREVWSGSTFFCLRGPRFDAHDFARAAIDAGASTLVVREASLAQLSPDVRDGAATLVVVDDPEKALVAAACEARRRFQGTVIGVTGSCGKTTTKDQLAAVLSTLGPTIATRGNQNNQLGVPLTLLRLEPATRFAVVEMGMNTPGEIALLARWARPSLGVVTTVGAAHLEGVGSLEEIAREKGSLLAALPADGVGFMPEAIALPWIVTRGMVARLETIGRGVGRGLRLFEARETETGCAGRVELGGARFDVTLRTPGTHNLDNALLALAVGDALGVDMGVAVNALGAMPAATLRGEVRTLASGHRVLLDCYNANPQSMRAAIESFKARAPHGLMVLGDMLELGPGALEEHAAIGRALGDFGGVVVGVGPLSKALVDAARAAGFSGERARWAPDADAAQPVVEALVAEHPWTLLKASRGMGLERVWAGLSGEGRGVH
jgi:UDP-N-acetylmuramoyl-tripeptide--D-alanyl-D-alanine ligase